MTQTNQKHPKTDLKTNSKNTSHIETVKTELNPLEATEKPLEVFSVTRTMRIIKEEKYPKLSPRALGGLVITLDTLKMSKRSIFELQPIVQAVFFPRNG
jgi:hypothetical protein